MASCIHTLVVEDDTLAYSVGLFLANSLDLPRCKEHPDRYVVGVYGCKTPVGVARSVVGMLDCVLGIYSKTGAIGGYPSIEAMLKATELLVEMAPDLSHPRMNIREGGNMSLAERLAEVLHAIESEADK